MKMKKIIKSLLLVSLIFASSCNDVDFGDTNNNINGASEYYTPGLLSGAILDFATNSGRDYQSNVTCYAQYQTQVVYTTEMRYGEEPHDWAEYYQKDLGNLKTIITYVGDPKNQSVSLLSQGSVNNQIGVAKILKAIIMKRVTDTYGDVPYSDAFRGTASLNPKYDKQEAIYKSIISDLKNGRDMLNSSELSPKGDVLYNGNLNKWKKLANSIILNASLQLSKKYPLSSDYASLTFNEALNNTNGVIESIGDEAWFIYDTSKGFRNPISLVRSTDYRMSREFTDALKGVTSAYNRTSNHTNDDRLKILANSTTKNGLPYGYSSASLTSLGISASTTLCSQMNIALRGNDSKMNLISASYTYLNRAEAAALGWTSENALIMLDMGIKKSYETLIANYLPTSTITATTYSAARVVDAGSDLLKVIREEKWVALFPNGFDAWSEWRRTSIPNLLPATDFLNNGSIPGRFNYPASESTLNAANYSTGVNGLVPAADKNSSKIWWAQ